MPDFVMQIGKSRKLTATVSPVNATNKAVRWISSNENILKVVDGTVCALAVGTATITARSADNNSIETYCNIRVTENVIVESVYISEDDIVLRPNGSTYLHEYVLPENATNPKVVWSSSDTSVATVNPESGLVMAQGEGTAKIYATAADGGRAQTYIYVTVEPIIPVESVTVNPTELKLAVGESVYMAKTVYPTDATDKRVTWCSSNPDVACVDCYSGYVTAKKAGTATITVTTVDGGYSDSLLLYVDGVSAGELTIFSCITDSSSIGSTNINGHSWLTYKNTTHSCVEILGVTLLPGREISFGAWGLPNMPRKGIWTGLEAFQVAEQGKNKGRVSHTIPLSSSEFELMKSCIHEENDYDLSSYNCAIMASLVWNVVAPMDMKLSVGLPVFTTPQVVCEAIESILGYEVNRAIMSPNTSEIGYPSPDGFVVVGEEDWRMSYTIYEYIINLFTIL